MLSHHAAIFFRNILTEVDFSILGKCRCFFALIGVPNIIRNDMACNIVAIRDFNLVCGNRTTLRDDGIIFRPA